MFWRDFRPEDVVTCLEIDPRRLGGELIGKDCAIQSWRVLMESCCFQSAVIETDPYIGGHRIVGFGASICVSRTFADQELANPRPGLNARIMASIDSGAPVILDESALREGNTIGGLDLVVLSPVLRRDALSPDQAAEAQMLIAAAFLDLHAGYRWSRFLTEIHDEFERQNLVEASGVWRVVSDFSEFYRAHPDEKASPGRALAVVTREEAFRVPGQVSGKLFTYREPVLDLQSSEQQLLVAALTGLTDEQLADKLRLGLPAVKKRWRSIFERVSARPDLFPGIGDGFEDGSRGRQKRHYILAYVREHPEELRPFRSRNASAAVRPTIF
jgi:hypothetical protein